MMTMINGGAAAAAGGGGGGGGGGAGAVAAVSAPKQIRFVNNAGQPPSKRRRINAACLTCRKRKTRCAGEKPLCSTCTKNGHECLGYSDLGDTTPIKKENGGLTSPLKATASGSRDLGNGDGAMTDDENDGPEEEEEEEDERRYWKAKNGRQANGAIVTSDKTAASKPDPKPAPANKSPRPHNREWEGQRAQQPPQPTRRISPPRKRSSYSDDGRNSDVRSPVQHREHTESHRVPYFRYFGPTAIVPGFKQMVVNVSVRGDRDRRRSRGTSFSGTSPASLVSHSLSHGHTPQGETVLEPAEDLPVYDPNDPSPVHPLIIGLVKTFFVHLGCNYPLLREAKCLRMVKEKRLEPILVDSMCALAARFSDMPGILNDNVGQLPRSEYGHVFAQRAKAATVDTFPCPTVGAVQACLLMAYEGFGANQDSALWMYLGLAIRMAVDLGLQKNVGVMYQGEKDPWYTRTWNRKPDDEELNESKPDNDEDALSSEEQKEVMQERIDTFWAVFILDRVISSGTGRPVTFKENDFELSLPEPELDPITGWPKPFPTFIRIIHLFGRVSDILNNIQGPEDLTQDKMHKLAQLENELTRLYQKQDPRLHFNPTNFQQYVKAGQGTNFILLHFWFHALIILLHSPALVLGNLDRSTLQLLPNSRELSMSSAKTIADILAFAELIDPKSFIGNPFTSQPMYIAACAFLMESVANTSEPTSREGSPSGQGRHGAMPSKPSAMAEARAAKHALLASAANQNYQRCYKSLQQLHLYWGGVKYILTALDQKSKGIWDCETYTNEEYESTKAAKKGSLRRFARLENPASPNPPPIAWSLTGTTNSPNSSLTLLYQNNIPPQHGPVPPPTQPSVPVSAATPPGNMIYDPIRQSLPDSPSMLPPAFPATNGSSRYVGSNLRHRQMSTSSNSAAQPAASRTRFKYDTLRSDEFIDLGSSPDSDTRGHGTPTGMAPSNSNHATQQPPASFTPTSQHSSGFDASAMPGASPSSSTLTDPMNSAQNQHIHSHSHHHQLQQAITAHGFHQSYITHHQHHGQGDLGQSNGGSGLTPGSSYSAYLPPGPLTDIITFDSTEIDIASLELPMPNEMMPPWLEYVPEDMFHFFDGSGGAHGGHQE